MGDDGQYRLAQVLARATRLRVRITIAAVLVVGLALAAGSVVLLGLLHATLKDYSRSAAERRADTLSSELSLLPGADLPSLARIEDDEFVQILDGAGAVLASTENAKGFPDLRLTGAGNDEKTVPFDKHPFVVVDKTVRTRQGIRTVVAGVDLEAADEGTGTLMTLLLVGCPLLLMVVAAMAWFAVGGTLAPVERIRLEADDISATELHRRLPEPARDDEIGRLARTMNRMLARLDHAQQRQRRFVSDAAHELRSPIASIKQNVEVATTYPDSFSTEELIETVRSETIRLERLTTALLRLARLDEHAHILSENAVDLDDLVLEEAQRLKSTTSFRIDASGVLAGRVGGDESLLAQVLRNLVDNAQRHTETTIALTLSEHERTVTLSVEDDGPGVPVADRELVFERFVRLDEARACDEGGSGLGLAIVSEVVAAYGGSVAVADSRLGGAAMVVTLPRLIDPM